MLDESRLRSSLRTDVYGRSLEVRALTDSTNDDAARAAATGAVRGHVVLADAQRQGRGSHGRTWLSPEGLDLYLSIVERPQLSLAQLPPLTLAVGLGVADAVAAALPGADDAVTVKWPNDIWLGERKCAGILVEAASMGESLTSLVIGIGLNVNRTEFPSDLEHPATSLALVGGAPLDRTLVAADLLARVEHRVDEFLLRGAEATSAALSPRLALRDRMVQCGPVRGRLDSVAADGALRILTPTGMVSVHSGRLKEIEDDRPC